jgi:hypothetical protein
MFRGKAMTYYGRWTYKYEIASAKGAAAAIIVHQTIPAAYGWDVVDHSNSHENMDVRHPDNNKGRVQVESWITYETAKKLFQAAGQDFDALERSARSKDFHPVDLKATATFHLANKVREVHSANILAKLEGSDPKVRDQYVIYTAHWDHLGVVDPINGDSIANGAIDNASGVAGVLAIAKAYTALPVKPRRSIIFMAVTAEEKGLLGAKYYNENPLYPLAHTVGTSTSMDSTSGAAPATSPWSARGRRRWKTCSTRSRPRSIGRCHPTPSRRRGSTTGPTISSSPSRAFRRSSSTVGSTTSASRTATARPSATSTPITTTTTSPTR